MSTITTDNKHYQDIANAIRNYSDTDNTYKPADMPVAIEKVFNAGFNRGETVGLGTGYLNGLKDGTNSVSARVENDILYVTKMELEG